MSQPKNFSEDNNVQLLQLHEEINFQQVLLKSIDHTVQDRYTAVTSIRSTIRDLRAQYFKLTRHAALTSSECHISFSKSKLLHDQHTSINKSSQGNNSIADTPKRTDTLASSYLSSLPSSRKRGPSENFLDIPTACKSSNFRRTCPADSGSISLEMYERPSFIDSLIDTDGNDELEEEFTEFFEKQQKVTEDRIRMEKLDEEYARKLQNEMDSSPRNLTPSVNNGSGSQRSGYVIPENSSRPLEIHPEDQPESYSLFLPESSFSSSYFHVPSIQHRNSTTFKAENYSFENPEIILNSSSDENESDVEFITASHLPPNVNTNHPNHRNFVESSWMSTFPFNNQPESCNYSEDSDLIYGPNFLTQKRFGGKGLSTKNNNIPISKSVCESEAEDNKRNGIKKIKRRNISSKSKLNRVETPESLVHPLYEHQKIAVAWLKEKEESIHKGAVLADDMGLGKTISSLALILMRRSSDPSCKTTLIVASVALIRQWEREIRIKIKPEFRLSTIIVHGSCKKPSWDEIRHSDVALTTYGTLASEFKRFEKWKEEGQKYNGDDLEKIFPLISPKSRFYRVILDEAQLIKNKNALSARACFYLNATYRICLTGTPMMNDYIELYSEFSSLIKMVGRARNLNPHIIATRKYQMKNLQKILEDILLRRTKDSLIDGKPIISLPPKSEEIHHVMLDGDERAFYHSLETKTQVQFNKYLAAGTVGKNYSSILVLLLRLRQACCHPFLIHDFEEAAHDGLKLPDEKMIDLAKNLQLDVVERLLNCNDAFECPICYDGVENPKILIPCGHDTCAECLAKITDQQSLHNASEDTTSSDFTAKCPTCRGMFSLGNVIDYNIFKKVHKNLDKSTNQVDEAEYELCSKSRYHSESENEANLNVYGDLRDFIRSKSTINAQDGPVRFKPESSNVSSEDYLKKKGKASFSESKLPLGYEDKKKHLSLAMLNHEAKKSNANRKRYFRYLRSQWKSSAKIAKCVELIQRFLDDNQKILIFSQFVSLLDLLLVPIETKKWNFLRYDGGMTVDDRNAAVHKFSDSASHNIMLLSLKAGNAGLNLVAASRVIILDPFWNPFIEMQAIDRAYRIGQQREVQVHRILVKDTVEDRIVELQEKKKTMVDAVLNKNASQNIWRLDSLQLGYLLGASVH